MNVLICGSRTFQRLDLVERYVEELAEIFSDRKLVIVTGGAVGPDDAAKQIAEDLGIDTETFLPEWDLHGKKAGILRNEKMVEVADKVYCFWDGRSKGTKSTIDFALKHKKHLEVIFDDKMVLN